MMIPLKNTLKVEKRKSHLKLFTASIQVHEQRMSELYWNVWVNRMTVNSN